MKRYTTFSIVFYSPISSIQTGQTNKQTNKHTHTQQTNKHKSSFNNKDYWSNQILDTGVNYVIRDYLLGRTLVNDGSLKV